MAATSAVSGGNNNDGANLTTSPVKDEDDKRAVAAAKQRSYAEIIRDPTFVCPYLDTIDRASLDFDFEKLCVMSLTNLNVYGCLVCGKYFHGRAKGTAAFNHSLSSGHHIFINLDTAQVYCLPDSYEVKDASLADIKYNLNPTYTADQIKSLTKVPRKSRGLDKNEFRPGFIGLNNLKMTDYLNVVVQGLAHIQELLEFYMMPFTSPRVPLLTRRFGELLRKIWNGRAFKGQVSPHELMQAITLKSSKKFQIGHPGDPVELLQFLINSLHEEELELRRPIVDDELDATGQPVAKKAKKATKKPLNATGTASSSSSSAISSSPQPEDTVVHRCFQGRVRVTTQKVKIKEDALGNKVETNEGVPTEKEVPFVYLQFALPDTPLFKEESERNIIPQVPLFTLLQKYDGEQTTMASIPGQTEFANKIKYSVTKLPKYLVFYYKRFSMNYWFEEKNKTIVNFPVKSLDMKDFVSPAEAKRLKSTKYDLVANICHESPQGLQDREGQAAGKGPRFVGHYYVHVFNRTTGEWYQMQDLDVKEAVPQEICCSAPYIQIWEAQDYTEATPAPAAAAVPSQPQRADGKAVAK